MLLRTFYSQPAVTGIYIGHSVARKWQRQITRLIEAVTTEVSADHEAKMVYRKNDRVRNILDRCRVNVTNYREK